MDLLNKLRQKLRASTIVEKLIYSFVIVFILENLIQTFYHFNSGQGLIFFTEFFSLSASSNNYLQKILNLVTYSFLHDDFIHLIFNLIVFYYFANLFVDFFNQKKLLNYFILGSVFGGTLFLLSNYFFTIIRNDQAYLVGASAGISAIIVGLATKMPNYEMNFRFIGYVKLWVLATIWVVSNIILMHNGNEGGKFSHLGGAFIGFFLTKYFSNNNNLSSFSFIKTKRSNLKTVYKKSDTNLSNYQIDNLKQRKIDALLDKISKSGYEVLTEDEKIFLDSASKN